MPHLLYNIFDSLPVLKRLKSGSKLYQNIEVAHGETWCIFFGYTHQSGDIILPHIQNAEPFYQVGPNIWLPVGAALNVAEPAQEDYLDEIRAANQLGRAEIFISPQFPSESEETNRADIFTIAEKLTVGQLVLETQQ